MITSRYINVIAALVVAAAVIFTAVFMFAPQAIGIESTDDEPEYIDSIFDDSKMNVINISMAESDWQEFLDNAASEEYASCDLTVNGVLYESVGIRCKGNTSLTSVTNDKYSFKFKADEYVSDQSFDGLEEFVVNNIIQDATYMKEYLSYDLLDYMGVPTPAKAYYDVYVNGEEWGVYLALEALEEDFTERNFDPDSNDQLYKVETTDMGGFGGMKDGEGMPEMPEGMEMPDFGGRGNRAAADGNGAGAADGAQAGMPEMPEGMEAPDADGAGAADGAQAGMPEMPEGMEAPDFGGRGNGMDGMGNAGATLKYTDDEVSSYSNIFDYAVFNPDEDDKQRVIKAIKALSTGEDIEEYWDVDEVIRYFAVNTAIVNLDSYVSQLAHNYYLYEEDGCISVVPWDYNLAFGAFESGSASDSVNFPVDTPVTSQLSVEDRPLLNMILENEEYLNKYHEYLSDIAENYFLGGKLETTVKKVQDIISGYIENQNTERAFYTCDEYLSAVDMLKLYCELRAESITGQLNGTVPATYDAQEADSGALIDSSAVNMSVMGSQGGQGGGPGGPGDAGDFGNFGGRGRDNAGFNNAQ